MSGTKMRIGLKIDAEAEKERRLAAWKLLEECRNRRSRSG